MADALRADGAQPPRVVFIGGERAERDLVPAAGYELRVIAVEGLSRTNPLKALRALAKAAGAVISAWRILGELRPDAVMGGGGYVAGPVGVAAVLRRIPLVLTEADSHLGVANRLLAPFARRVCLAFPLDGRDGERYRVTGRPVPAAASDRAAARERFGIDADERVLVVFGGSLGARTINEAAVGAFATAGDFHVLHAAGERDLAALRGRLAQAPAGHYDLRGFIDGFGDALLAGDHQAANARWMERAGAAVVVPDAELTPARLAQEVAALLGDPARLDATAAASKALARPGAAGEIAGELVRAGEGAR